jgi:5-formyltetrahydrofolate cyclo-ligase
MSEGQISEADLAKAALRSELRAHRKRLAFAKPDAAARAASHFREVGVTQSLGGEIHAAALYHPVGAEMDPKPLGRLLAARGVKLGWPVVTARGEPLVFREQDEHAPLVADAIGILSPPTYAPAVRPDLVVTPLLAFDRRGGRLGQGGGFYDRTISALRASGKVFILGLAYAGQELPDIPMGPYDERLDGVLTEDGYVRLGQ